MAGWGGESSRVRVDQMPQPRYSVEGVWEWWWCVRGPGLLCRVVAKGSMVDGG